MKNIRAKFFALWSYFSAAWNNLTKSIVWEPNREEQKEMVKTDIALILLSLSQEDRAELDQGQELLLPIQRSFLLKTLYSKDPTALQIVSEAINELNNGLTNYSVGIFSVEVDLDALAGLPFDYFLSVTLDLGNKGLDFEEEDAEAPTELVVEMPKVMTMAAGAGRP